MTRREIEEIWAIVREYAPTIQKLFELYQQMKESHDRMSEEIKELKESQKKTDEQMKQTDEKINKLTETVANTNKMVGGLTNSWGLFVECLAAPSALKYMRQKGYKSLALYQRSIFSRNGHNKEYDILVEDSEEKVVFILSAKVQVTARDVKELLRDMDKFPYYTREKYRGYRVFGGIAGMSIKPEVERYGLEKGVVILRVSEDVMEVREPPKIRELRI